MSTLAVAIMSMVICTIASLTIASFGITPTLLGGVGTAILSAAVAIGVAGGIDNVE